MVGWRVGRPLGGVAVSFGWRTAIKTCEGGLLTSVGVWGVREKGGSRGVVSAVGLRRGDLTALRESRVLFDGGA